MNNVLKSKLLSTERASMVITNNDCLVKTVLAEQMMTCSIDNRVYDKLEANGTEVFFLN